MSENSKKSVLVVGATGFLGTEICRQLIITGKNVIALVRNSSDPAKLSFLQQLGVETREGDLKDTASIKKAIEGVQTIISTASSTLSRQEGDSIESVDYNGQINLIRTAKVSGVNQFIFISFCPMSQQFPLQTAKRKVESELKESKMNYTILQAGFFMEVWLSPAVGFDFPNSKATIYGEGNNKINWISLQDVAAIAVASVDNDAFMNSIFQLGGPEALSPLEAVGIFEKHSGNLFELQHVPVAALIDQKNSATDSLSESFAALMLIYAAGDDIDMSETRKVYPFRLTSVTDYVQRVVIKHEV